MKTYIIEICKTDGTTPLGQCPKIEIDAEDRHDAVLKVLTANPDHEIVSWGLKSEIEAFHRRS